MRKPSWEWHEDVPRVTSTVKVPKAPVPGTARTEKVTTGFEVQREQRRRVAAVRGGLYYSSGKGASLRFVPADKTQSEKAPVSLFSGVVDVAACGDLIAVSDNNGTFCLFGGSKPPLYLTVNARPPTKPSTNGKPEKPDAFISHFEWLDANTLSALSNDLTLYVIHVPSLQDNPGKKQAEPQALAAAPGVITVRVGKDTPSAAPAPFNAVSGSRHHKAVAVLSKTQYQVEVYEADPKGGGWRQALCWAAHGAEKVSGVQWLAAGGRELLATAAAAAGELRVWEVLRGDKASAALLHDVKLPFSGTGESLRIVGDGAHFIVHWKGQPCCLLGEVSVHEQSVQLSFWRQDCADVLELGFYNHPDSGSVYAMCPDGLALFAAHQRQQAARARLLPEPFVAPDDTCAPLPPSSFSSRSSAEEVLLSNLCELSTRLSKLSATCLDFNAVSRKVDDLNVAAARAQPSPNHIQSVYDGLMKEASGVVESLARGVQAVDGGRAAWKKSADELESLVGEKRAETAAQVAKRDDPSHRAALDTFKAGAFDLIFRPELHVLSCWEGHRARQLVASEIKSIEALQTRQLTVAFDALTEYLSQHTEVIAQSEEGLLSRLSDAVQAAEAAIVVPEAKAEVPNLLPGLQNHAASLDKLKVRFEEVVREQFSQLADLPIEGRLRELLAQENVGLRPASAPTPSTAAAPVAEDVPDAMFESAPKLLSKAAEKALEPGVSALRDQWSAQYLAHELYSECVYAINDATSADNDPNYHMAWLREHLHVRHKEVAARLSLQASLMLLRDAVICFEDDPKDDVAIDWIISLSLPLDAEQLDAHLILQPLVVWASNTARSVLPKAQSNRQHQLEMAILNLECVI
ncbi:hypothetical protein DIPPA_26541 [Diplonema papillatum]|nr:hypothetical protein DIPPA_26541 [Diplonema papillatum]